MESVAREEMAEALRGPNPNILSGGYHQVSLPLNSHATDTLALLQSGKLSWVELVISLYSRSSYIYLHILID